MRSDSIPVIDIEKLESPATLAQLDHACRNWGFVQVRNHGIADSVVRNLSDEMHAFFAQPDALTLLLQNNQPGLEVFRNNQWRLVEPRRDALVINLGDIVQVWSNDCYCASLHRTVTSAAKARFSVPYFFNPEYRTNYAPAPTMVVDGEPPRYREINWGEFRALRADGDYADYGEEVQIAQYKISA